MTSVIYMQPIWCNFKDYRLMGQHTITLNILKRADLKLEYNHFYDSNPPDGVRSLIYSYTLGFRIKLGD